MIENVAQKDTSSQQQPSFIQALVISAFELEIWIRILFTILSIAFLFCILTKIKLLLDIVLVSSRLKSIIIVYQIIRWRFLARMGNIKVLVSLFLHTRSKIHYIVWVRLNDSTQNSEQIKVIMVIWKEDKDTRKLVSRPSSFTSISIKVMKPV